jgi:hypothetical protein
MKRTLLAAIALFVALPATASADTVDGVVVARDAGRGVVMTAGRGGTVTTLHVARPAAFKPGLRVRANANALGDGTYRATSVKRRGRVRAAKARFLLVRRSGRSLLVSAGGSTFPLAAGPRARVSAPGAIVAARLRVAKGKVAVAKATEVGRTPTLELSGRVTGLADGVLRLDNGVAVTVPAGVEPALQAGDEVELLVAVGADGSLTLLAIDGEIEVYGPLTAVAPGSLTVGAVTCAVPGGLDVSDLVLGDTVQVLCSVVNGVLTADELEVDDPGVEDEPIDELEPEE